jgi:hypothetical protein
MKPGSISRLRASCQQLDSESDKEKQPPFVTLAGDYPIRKRYVNLALLRPTVVVEKLEAVAAAR